MDTRKQYPVEVWDEMQACCYVLDERTRSLVTHSSKRITFGESKPGANGETEDVLLDGAKVGFRFFSYE